MKTTFALVLLLSAVPAIASEGAAKYFANVALVDQDGKPTDLYSLMRDRTIVMNTFFATCTGSCPVMARSLAAVQDRYADRLGKDLVIVSITVDPANDTPAKLKAYAKSVSAKRGWYFLTGTKEQVEVALKRIGQYADTRDAHMNVIVAGNDRTGLWKKAFGLAKPQEIVDIVGSVLDDRGP